MKLNLNLVPATMWYINLRKMLTSKSWSELGRECFDSHNNVCQICGMTGIYNNGKIKVECHEEWSYDDTNKIQKLESLLSLCTMCHRVKHFGLWSLKGQKDRLIKHICRVNDWSVSQAIRHINEEMVLHSERSQHDWNLDISLILNNPKTSFKKPKI